jgi:tetratricopeptide (TPR) repeat protein
VKNMRDWAKVGILACVSLGLIGGLCEVGLRLLEGVELKSSAGDEKAPKGFMRQDDILKWVPRKGVRQEGIDPYGQQYMVRINDSGQRGAEVEPRQPRERRILFLGDSFTIGSSLREADLFVPQIGQLLHERTERPIQTINAGVDGYNTLQEMGYYHLYGRSLDPDIVVLCFFIGNDFRDNAVNTNRGKSLNPVLVPAAIREKYLDLPDPFLRGQEDRLLLDPLSGVVVLKPTSPALAALARKSFLGRLLGARYTRLMGEWTDNLWAIDLQGRYYYYEIGLYQRRADQELEIAVNLTLDLIGQLQRMVAEEGAEFMVALLPSQNQVDPAHWRKTLALLDVQEENLGELDKTYPHRLIEQFCATKHIACLDLLDTFAAAPQPQDLYLTVVDDPHFSPAGHRLAAATLADFIATQSALLTAPAVDSFWAGLEYARKGDRSQAEQQLHHSAAQKGDWVAPLIALGDLYRAAQQWPEAAHAYRQALERNTAIARAHSGLGEALVAIGDNPGAINAYVRALELQSEWWPYYQILQELYTREGRTQEADKAKLSLEVFFEIFDDIKFIWWIEHLMRGDRFASRRQWSAAGREYTRALRFLPDERESPETLLNLGTALRHQGKNKEALPFIERAFTYKPALIQAGMEAALLHGETGELAKAIALLEKVVLQAPQWVDAWVNLGAYYARNGAYEKARAAQMKALTLVPDHPQARANVEALDRRH